KHKGNILYQLKKSEYDENCPPKKMSLNILKNKQQSNMKIKLFTLCFLSIIYTMGHAQEIEPAQKELTKKEKRKLKKEEPPHKGSVYFTPLPVISANPSFGFMYGVATSTSWYWGDPSTTNISSMFAGVTLTTKGQTLITAKATAFSENNDYKVDMDLRYLKSSQATYGLGSGPLQNRLAYQGFDLIHFNNQNAFSKPIDGAQLLEFNWARTYLTVTKKIKSGVYAGIGYHLDAISNFKDNLLDTVSLPPVITSFYAYNTKYGFSQLKNTLSGISLNGIYDTRDNVNATYKGRFAQLTYRINPEFLGSDQNSTSLWAEYRDYFDLTKDHKNMLAVWAFGSFQTSGNLPYMNLPGVGYDQYSSSGRGYTQGSIKGQSLTYTEIEYRRKLFGNEKNPDKWGIAVFANATTASNKDADIKLFKYIDPAFGVGIRYMVNPKSRTTLCLDYAIGSRKSSGIYLGLNEFF
ncbi:MAG: BamA/TamA family outer membrane protein, partial [Saprospiraceae bacterium]